MEIEKLIINLTDNYKNIIDIDIIKNNKKLYWGGNGVGDRWLNKKYNYSVIYSNGKIKNYSENIDDKIPNQILINFLINKNNKINGIIGIFVYSKRINIIKRPINKDIIKLITAKSCVICGSKNNIICDHKNDLYNDKRVLNINTQVINDFQPLCNHCNLQKRQICKEEIKNNKLYSAKNIERYKQYLFEFSWEKKIFDLNDINCKKDTYWYDPVEFERKINLYIIYILPIIKEIKTKIKLIS